MFDEKFGFMPKKRIKYDGHIISIGNHVISELKLHCIYVRPFDFLKNEWGSVYFSVNGEDYDPNDLLAKNVFKYTKKQTEKVWEFLNMLDVEIIQVDSDFNKASDQTKREKKISIPLSSVTTVVARISNLCKIIARIFRLVRLLQVLRLPEESERLLVSLEKKEITSSSASPVTEL